MFTADPRMTSDKIIGDLRKLYGTEFTAADVRGYCASHNVSYQTVTKRLTDFKVGKGKWNLEVTLDKVEEIERSYNAPAVEHKLEQNLVPEKDDTFVHFGPFSDLKAIINSNLF